MTPEMLQGLHALRLGFYWYFSNRIATCRICREKIQKHELRVWVRYPYPAFGMIAHPSCISKEAREIAKWAKDIEKSCSAVLK